MPGLPAGRVLRDAGWSVPLSACLAIVGVLYHALEGV